MVKTGLSLHITGIVQGVGFRPFIYNLAEKLLLGGWVKNTSAGVDIYVEGSSSKIDDFVNNIKNSPPPLSIIDNISLTSCQPQGLNQFCIIHSESIPNAFQPISPDVCICEDCLHEMFNPDDRRYRYPFINCTNCGPRFTIIKDIPYDRPNTTMAGFKMCPACEEEYTNPIDRRFHAQPIACPDCGPHVWLDTGDGSPILKYYDAILRARELIQEGNIIAVKGLGGFHLVCDATNQDAVIELRRRKLRVDKPFALMLPDLKNIEINCLLDDNSRKQLESRQRPIVIVPRHPESHIVNEVAPGQSTIGVMLPYTPLHYLLFANQSTCSSKLDFDDLCLVMTSGNISEEPIATDNKEALERLSSIADAFLFHDRPIYIRCDDSVVRTTPSGDLYSIRRSRSYTPFPIRFPQTSHAILATGGELKNTFCMTRENHAFLSQHIGDMENYETYLSFIAGIDHMERIFRINPSLIACDLHPNYLATRYAVERAKNEGLPLIQVQHHHSHIAACMIDNGVGSNETVLGVAFDGTGYGADGMTWGGEFLITTYQNYTRTFHLKYFPLPGGDRGIYNPARIGLAYLWKSGIEWHKGLPCVQALCAKDLNSLASQLKYSINIPQTSSMGRLFDAAASIAGVRQKINYEAQAAIELEMTVDPVETNCYPYEVCPGNGDNPGVIDPTSTLVALSDDVLSKLPLPIISARFHNTIANIVVDVARISRTQFNVDKIVLSGGVWQNMTLLAKVLSMLNKENFTVNFHHQVPTNDGGIALGQAAIAAYITDI